MGMTKDSKAIQYAAMIQGAIGTMFQEDGVDGYRIDMEELKEGGNLTEFFHALATIVPAYMYNDLTGNDADHLEFNHIANRMCFQFSTQESEEKED